MGVFDIFKKGLEKTRGFVSEGLTRISASIGHFDDDMLDDMEALLVEADCGVGASLSIMDDVRESIKKTGDDSKEAVMHIISKQMLDILGEKTSIKLEENNLNIILMVGVNGTGKTTTAGKLALRFKQDGKKVMLAAADTFRAAAIQQLEVWAKQTDTHVISHEEGSDPAAVCYDAVHSAIAKRADVLIIDTAGRLHNKQNLMDELSKICRVISREAPSANCQALLIIDATTGQNAVIQAEVFSKAVKLSGIGITKLDGSAKGGVAIAVSYSTKTPIMLAGLGESAEDLVDFDPEVFVKSLLPNE
ncbi:MAG TPA: signal recognition particle-docking protein FtsY [Bacillota bacterium]|nr:signal recognition particle-docking protein FtsY [Bacillota bacterium]HPE38762.1 signal recognition particle-docking protein FtsY [Bacillota bacterium]